MSDNQTPRFDPRFNPAFQRGFDGDGEFEPEADAGGADARREPERRLAEPTAPAQSSRIVHPRAPATAYGRADVDPFAATPDPWGAVVEVEEQGPEPQSSRVGAGPQPWTRNPFLLALAVIAVVLVVAGIGLFVRSGAAFNSADITSQGDYVTMTSLLQAAPIVVLLGVATAIGLLFVLAMRWGQRSR
ncbi:hypothetical protein [Galbitalea soli]|uniref:Uncharacterized protein n=1 Tax=Galbitalea soli TaxID=1268042 RepID=A0A7C9TS09_9MICO|nr:hypothetical protein [Galbitalea soli]NEM92079.1 hypothetical protein [Galbitalea soli]NYJ31969.1 hypothetical protein [Galbitalea soli]